MINILKKGIKKLMSFFYTTMVKVQCYSYIYPIKINGKSKVTKKTYLGKNINFNGMIISGCGEVHIGDNFHSGTDCLMITQVHNYEGKTIPYDNTYICKEITIEDNVWLGCRVIILAGVNIGEGAIIQAGSVVVHDIPKYAIAGGHPAKIFSSRNREHYEELKIKGKFH
jgi:acetyltransferase-like isoleucine patch superfamily enzyme